MFYNICNLVETHIIWFVGMVFFNGKKHIGDVMVNVLLLKQISSPFHQKVTCSRHDIAENGSYGIKQSLTRSPTIIMKWFIKKIHFFEIHFFFQAYHLYCKWWGILDKSQYMYAIVLTLSVPKGSIYLRIMVIYWCLSSLSVFFHLYHVWLIGE